jgi:glucuronate isomerase
MIKTFLNDNFLLQNSVAELLYHDYAKLLPIIDYHNHLPPAEVADNKMFSTITEVWLKGDHYKWRAMRANGIDERFITGDASDREKFRKWSQTVPYTMRNPLYHWTHLELQRYFGINELLSTENADEVYDATNEKLNTENYSAPHLLERMRVEIICTTDHPTDSLSHHSRLRSANNYNFQMLPTFRPDKFLVIDGPDFLDFLEKLESISESEIRTYDQLVAALETRIDFFHSLGGRLADHGLRQLYATESKGMNFDSILRKRLDGGAITAEESQAFQTALLHELGKMYHAREWTMQLHLGAIRNNNDRLLKSIGADVGCDSIGDYPQAEGLAYLLNGLDKEHQLSKTILYNLNPGDNELFATMMGNFNDGSMPGKIQWGSAWWFLDQKDGMEKQINALSNMGLLSRFLGMLTDSRSFLSFPRHEYFRRILCNLIGQDVHNGELPNDLEWLGSMVADICYGNAKRYFNFD